MKTPIRRMASDDWPSVRQIYQDGIDGGDATFETDAGDWKSWDSRYRPDCRFVATQGGRVVGWAALSPVSSRDAYRGVAEVSVYVSHQSSMRRVGTDLLQVLVEASESVAIWTLEARVFPENVAHWRFTRSSASGGSATANGSAGCTRPGATPSLWNGAARAWGPADVGPRADVLRSVIGY